MIILRITKLYIKIISIFESVCLSILLLLIRLWMANIFFYSGLTKISNWTTTIALFKEEYKTPFPEISAYVATATELLAPIFLIIGLMSRLATIPMLIMAAVIQFTYLYSIEHMYWGILLFIILFVGPGKLSLDHLIKNRLLHIYL
jgi:putative oxidoreductase